MVPRLALLVNANNQKPHLKHFPCPKYVMICRHTIYIPES